MKIESRLLEQEVKIQYHVSKNTTEYNLKKPFYF